MTFRSVESVHMSSTAVGVANTGVASANITVAKKPCWIAREDLLAPFKSVEIKMVVPPETHDSV